MKIYIDKPYDVINAKRNFPELRPVTIDMYAPDLLPNRFREILHEKGYNFNYGPVNLIEAHTHNPLMRSEWNDDLFKYVLRGPIDRSIKL